MKKPNLLFLGIFAVFAFAFWGTVLVPQSQLAALQPQVDEDTGEAYPVNMGGAQAAGREIYIANGCQSCHSQEVRSAHNGPDIERGWGKRRTVPLDYLYDQPAVLSQIRIGPDLANLGAIKNATGQPKHTAQSLYRHLYFPRYDAPDSVMPPYRYLFEKRKISGERAVDALDVQVADGYEIVPTEKARTLVAYLLSLDRTHELKNPAAPAAAAPATK
jgi:cytochrome c oxidase cbb3-type subunit 2